MSTLIQRSFANGELTPRLYQRVDLTKYSTGLRKARNGYIEKDGGFTNRPGTGFIYSAATSKNRLIPWISSTDLINYQLIFSETDVRFIFLGQLLRPSATPAAYNNLTAYVQGDLVRSAGISYYAKQATTGNAPPNATYWHPLPQDSVGDIYSIPTPWDSFNADKTLAQFQYVQSGTFLTVVHGNMNPPADLINTGGVWTWRPWTLFMGTTFYGVPSILAPTGLTASGGGSGGAAYIVTSVDANGEESLAPPIFTPPTTYTYPAYVETSTVPSPGTPVTLNWTAAVGAESYNIYKAIFGTWKLIFNAGSTSFVDTGYTADVTADGLPFIRKEFINFFGLNFNKIGMYQQRTLLGGRFHDYQEVFASEIGFRQNFTKRDPQFANSSFSFKIFGETFNGVKHIVDAGALVVFTEAGEWIIKGDNNGAIKPDAASPEQYSANGASDVRPIKIGSDVLYIQNRGNIVRALGFDSLSGGRDGYRDDDLTAFANHLFKNKTIVAMAYQKTPNSIVWMVTDDGALLSLTLIRSQQILAWCRHDTDGEVLDICSIPEGTENALYLVVKRNIDGTDLYNIERMNDRNVDDVRDYIFMDSSLSYDGRNTNQSHTMTLTGGTAWDDSEVLTLTSSQAFFQAGDVGNEIQLSSADESVMRRLEIVAYTSSTVVSVRPRQLIPVSLRATALSVWAKAVDELSGLDHLEGKAVSVFADGYVIASPNNDKYDPIVVASGAINLAHPYAVIHVGLPFISDLETLDIDTVNGETIVDKRKLVGKVTMHVEGTRGVFVGDSEPTGNDPLKNLMELKLREFEDLGDPIEVTTGVVDVNIPSDWNSNGRVFVRQVDPIPMSILSVAPAGFFPFKG